MPRPTLNGDVTMGQTLDNLKRSLLAAASTVQNLQALLEYMEDPPIKALVPDLYHSLCSAEEQAEEAFETVDDLVNALKDDGWIAE